MAEPIISISDEDPDGDVKSECVASDITAVGEVKNDSSDSDVGLQKSLCSYVERPADESAGAAEGTNAAAVKEDPNGTRFGNGIAPDLDQQMQEIPKRRNQSSSSSSSSS